MVVLAGLYPQLKLDLSTRKLVRSSNRVKKLIKKGSHVQEKFSYVVPPFSPNTFAIRRRQPKSSWPQMMGEENGSKLEMWQSAKWSQVRERVTSHGHRDRCTLSADVSQS